MLLGRLHNDSDEVKLLRQDLRAFWRKNLGFRKGRKGHSCQITLERSLSYTVEERCACEAPHWPSDNRFIYCSLGQLLNTH
ncbi:unnamed protein product [Enterobius vermicularis]|uniref:Uncharacterized protein n=1 Tax=Enterobius vermicularis TaxID=51028 RepID=A0A0N4UT26_ENTVE|nr:unnamed protein product [Enterobius vermicularis]